MNAVLKLNFAFEYFILESKFKDKIKVCINVITSKI